MCPFAKHCGTKESDNILLGAGYHYKVTVTLAKTSTSQQERGKLYAKITGTSGQSEEVQLTPE